MANKNVKTVYKVKWKNMSYAIGVALVGIALLFGIYKGFVLFKDYKSTRKLIDEIKDKAETSNIVDDAKTQTIRPDSTISKFDAYWDYIKLGLLDVNMAGLKKMNAEAVGYIEVKGTDFSYPVALGEYYKSHSFDKLDNSLGWIYVKDDFDADNLETNTIIYGNKNFLGVLASDLNEVFKDDWNSNNENFIVKFYTDKFSSLWQIISVYKTKEKDYLETSFESDEILEKYIDKALKSTKVKFKGTAKTTDKFLTLTTNSRGSNLVVQAKLIKIRTE